jgi:hypothetical protein
MGEAPSVLFDLAERLLAGARSLLDEVGGTPRRAGVYPGDIPDEWDECGVLAVSVPTLDLTPSFPAPGDQAEWDCASGRGVADFVVVLVECVPVIDETGQTPVDKAVTESARRFYTDAWRVWTGLLCAATELVGEGRSVVVRGMAVTGPLGGAARATFRVGVDVSA